MRFFDAILTLGIGLLLVTQPQAFFKARGSPEEIARRRGYLRKLGFILLGAGCLLAIARLHP